MSDVKPKPAEFSGKKCPKCGSTLLTDGQYLWCSFVGGDNQRGCDYGIVGDRVPVADIRPRVELSNYEFIPWVVNEDGSRQLAWSGGFNDQLAWCREAARDNVQRRVICNVDVFDGWQGHLTLVDGSLAVSRLYGKPIGLDYARNTSFRLIDLTPNLDWLLVTKHPENIRRMWPTPSNSPCRDGRGNVSHDFMGSRCLKCNHPKRRDNVWLGTSIATQEDADKNIPELLKCRDLSPVLFVCVEPIEPIDLMYPPSLFPNGQQMCCNGRDCGCQGMPIDPCPWFYPHDEGIDLVTVRGEVGPLARPMHPNWVQSLREQCRMARVPFFFAGWGEWVENGPRIDVSESTRWGAVSTAGEWTEYEPRAEAVIRPSGQDACMVRVGWLHSGRTLDGREWLELPNVDDSN